jgi:hypothetical protein
MADLRDHALLNDIATEPRQRPVVKRQPQAVRVGVEQLGDALPLSCGKAARAARRFAIVQPCHAVLGKAMNPLADVDGMQHFIQTTIVKMSLSGRENL